MTMLAFFKSFLFDQFLLGVGGGKGGGSAPSAPDPMTVANATTQTNNATAAYNKALNGGNYSNLFGSSQQVQTGTDPNTGAPIYSTQQSANPQLQNLFSLNLGQAGNSTDINNSALSGIGQLSNGYNTLQNELQGLQGNYSSNNAQLQNIMGQNSSLNQGLGGLQSQYSGLNSSIGGLQNQYAGLNSGISGLGSQYAGLQGQLGSINASIDPNAGKLAQQQGQDAAYAAQTQYLDPQFAQGQSSIESQLANQGLTPGSQAYTNAMTNFNNSKQQAYSNAANQSILTGSSIGQQSLNNQLNAANTQAGLVGQQGSMVGNQANLFGLQGNNLAAQAGLYGQQGSNLGAQAGIYGQQASNLGQQISALGQQSANTGAQAGIYGQQGSNLGQQASLYGQQVGIGQLPYSNASTIGSMIPGYGGSATSASSPANISQLYQNQYQGQLNNYNQQVGSANSTMSGLFGLGSAGIMATMFSDRRLKTDIEAVTRWSDGMNFYRYRYVWDEAGVTRYGFMADEVRAVKPDAVKVHESGFEMVDYDRAMEMA